MYDLKRSIRRHAVGCAGLLCLILVVASASRCTSDSITGAEPPATVDADPIGTIQGNVTSEGSPLSSVEIWISSPQTSRRSAITNADGAFTFTLPAGGPYTVQLATGASPANICEAVNAMVEAERSVSVQILCRPIGILKGLLRWTNGSIISDDDVHVGVSLSGPVSRESETTDGRFGFYQLPAGVYTVTPGVPCAQVTVTVELGRVTNADISCGAPTFVEIQGEWTFSLAPSSFDDPSVGQTGDCPPQMAFPAMGSIAFDVATNRVSIVGLAPDLTIVAQLDPAICEGTSCFRGLHEGAGTGSADRPDGFSLRSGGFSYNIIDGGTSLWFVLEREHRIADNELVCSEFYSLEGTGLRH